MSDQPSVNLGSAGDLGSQVNAMLQDLLARPGDRACRLVLADALEDLFARHGVPHEDDLIDFRSRTGELALELKGDGHWHVSWTPGDKRQKRRRHFDAWWFGRASGSDVPACCGRTCREEGAHNAIRFVACPSTGWRWYCSLCWGMMETELTARRVAGKVGDATPGSA